jgi:hypothetical protein
VVWRARPGAAENSAEPLTIRLRRNEMASQAIDGSLTAAQLRAALDYEPRTGMFIWKQREPGGKLNTWAGRRAGCHKKGPAHDYIVIRINYQLYRAHRLAVLWMTGKWPEFEVDHRDGDPLNNRWKNLRVATSSQNKMNARKRSDNTSGYKGVWFEKRRNQWVAEIMVNERKRHVGLFTTIEEARAAREAAARALHGKFARID